MLLCYSIWGVFTAEAVALSGTLLLCRLIRPMIDRVTRVGENRSQPHRCQERSLPRQSRAVCDIIVRGTIQRHNGLASYKKTGSDYLSVVRVDCRGLDLLAQIT